ncbi:hypothetical protein, partial [Azospirillum himalayense]
TLHSDQNGRQKRLFQALAEAKALHQPVFPRPANGAELAGSAGRAQPYPVPPVTPSAGDGKAAKNGG